MCVRIRASSSFWACPFAKPSGRVIRFGRLGGTSGHGAAVASSGRLLATRVRKVPAITGPPLLPLTQGWHPADHDLSSKGTAFFHRMSKITGLHHITALGSDAQRLVEFYAGVLGLRLVKRTVNFDAPDVHHLYFGDGTGSPGTIITFFPYPGLVRGRKGRGQASVIMLSIGPASVDHWLKRLDHFQVEHEEPRDRWGGETYIPFADPDGLCLELVVDANDDRVGNPKGPVEAMHAIKGCFGITLSEDAHGPTAALLTSQLEHRQVQEEEGRFRYMSGSGAGGVVDIHCSKHDLRGLGGSGTVHHVAFSTPDDDGQASLRERLAVAGFNVTSVMERQYFRSIYFREPGGVLFEIATATPGFLVDEQEHELGSALKLPPWAEAKREQIAEHLSPISLDLNQYRHPHA